MAQLSDLPVELKLIVLHYCSFQAHRALFLVSQDWHKQVLDKPTLLKRIGKRYLLCHEDYAKTEFEGLDLFKILLHHGMAALQEWALHQEPEGELAYGELQTIHNFKTIDQQKKLECFAQKSATAARLILYHKNYWIFIQPQKARAHFIQNVMGKWPEAIYYALENEILRKQWLPSVVSIHTPCNKKCDAICNMINAGGRGIAWLWSTDTELYLLLANMKDPWWLSVCIDAIIQAGGQQVALLWSTQAKLFELLNYIKSDFLHLIKTLRIIIQVGGQQVALLWSTQAKLHTLLSHAAGKHPCAFCLCICSILEAGGEQVALLWSTTVQLRQLLGYMTTDSLSLALCIHTILQVGDQQVARLWSTDTKLYEMLIFIINDAWQLSGCICEIIKKGDHQVALLWSSKTKLITLLAGITDSLPLLQCIRTIVEKGGKQIAVLWSTSQSLRNIIASIEDKAARLDCLMLLEKIGEKEAKQGCLLHPVLSKDLGFTLSKLSR